MIAAAHTLIIYYNTRVSMTYLELVTNLSEEFKSDFASTN